MIAPVQRRPISSLARWNRAQSSGGWAEAVFADIWRLDTQNTATGIKPQVAI